MRIDLDREQAEIATEVIRSAAALERERSRRLREDVDDAAQFGRVLRKMFIYDNEAMRRLAARIVPLR